MSWSIANLDNTVVISDAVALEMVQKFPDLATIDECDTVDEKMEYLRDGDVLFFSCDHMEHMDWMSDEVCQFLASHNVEGDITFGSVEGDNAGSFWGYRFDGKGGFVRLSGDVVWTPNP